MLSLAQIFSFAMEPSVLLITPPFTQSNTPYPATAFLKGFLNLHGVRSAQCDLGLKVILSIFSAQGLEELFDTLEERGVAGDGNIRRIVAMRNDYLATIDPVIRFLQDRDPSLARMICNETWLPRAGRFFHTEETSEAFGTMGLRDRARHLATLYLEDLSDLITQTVDPHFGFSRYGERLGRSPATFDELETLLCNEESFTDRFLLRHLQEDVDRFSPSVVALTVPFPGNLYSALRCGSWIRKNHPGIRVVIGGGYVSTELRSVTDPRLFNHIDYLLLDDGEKPVLALLRHLRGELPLQSLLRCHTLEHGSVVCFNASDEPDCRPEETGTPDYEGLSLNDYLSLIGVVNPMHSLWSDGRWNRIMLAHGCYWAKCTFCDTSLDYIRSYRPTPAPLLCDRMEAIMKQTGSHEFHFVDEAAPPALLRDLALEILRRGMVVTWWTNIRFEKSFTPDLCILLKASGCIAVSGGLEVASDRILNLINKGVSVVQAANVAANLSDTGILVHTYLMYGFPTQSARETIDSLEVVRQLFLNGLIHSGFWHLFTMTAHSAIGANPEQFGAGRTTEGRAPFANNDLPHLDPTGCRHADFAEGLRKALYNYMHGACLDHPLQAWFDFKIPATTIAPGFIRMQVTNRLSGELNLTRRLIWLGGAVTSRTISRNKKGKHTTLLSLTAHNRSGAVTINLNNRTGEWLLQMLPRCAVLNAEYPTLEAISRSFEDEVAGDFNQFWNSQPMQDLRRGGLVSL